MRLGPQPRRRRGTIDRPYSALNLRLILASVGLVGWIGLAVLAFIGGYRVVAWALVVLAALAVVDLVIIQVRRRARHRQDGGGHSLFE
jgi:membrane protein YdbS with pleckstrin-like domain